MLETRLDNINLEKADPRVLIFNSKEEAKKTIRQLDPNADLKNLFSHHYVSRNTLSFSYECELFKDFIQEPIYENDIYYMIHKQEVDEIKKVNPLEFGLVRKFTDEEIDFLIDNLTNFQIAFLKSNFFRGCKLEHYSKLWKRFSLDNATYRYTTINLRINGEINLVIVRQELVAAYILKHLRYLEIQKPNSILSMAPSFNINTMETMTKKDLTSYLEVPISLLRLKGTQTSQLAYDLESCRINETNSDKEYLYSVEKVKNLLLSKYKNRGQVNTPTKLPDDKLYQLVTLFNELNLSSYFVSVQSLNNSMVDRVNCYELAPKVIRYDKEEVENYVKFRVKEYHLAIQDEQEENIQAIQEPVTEQDWDKFEKNYQRVDTTFDKLATTMIPEANYRVSFAELKLKAPRYYLVNKKGYPIVSSAKANENTYYKYDEFNSMLNASYGYWNDDLSKCKPCHKEDKIDIRKNSLIANHNLYEFYQTYLQYQGAYPTFKKKSTKAIKEGRVPYLLIGKRKFFCTEFILNNPSLLVE